MHSSSGASTVRVGVAGFGYWGPKLVRNFSEMTDAELSWVSDLDAGRLARVRQHYPAIQTTQSFDEMLRSDVDAVVVATPIWTHYRLTKAALLAGKHVMVEKPLTADSRDSADWAPSDAGRRRHRWS